jgi:hypothetical protein
MPMSLLWTLTYVTLKPMYFKRSYQLQLLPQHCSLPLPARDPLGQQIKDIVRSGRVENVDHSCTEYSDSCRVLGMSKQPQFWCHGLEKDKGLFLNISGQTSLPVPIKHLSLSLTQSLSHFQFLFQDTCAVIAPGSATLLKTFIHDPWFISWWVQITSHLMTGWWAKYYFIRCGKMWSGPHLRYNTAITFEGLGKNHNESKDEQSLGTGLQTETPVPRVDHDWACFLQMFGPFFPAALNSLRGSC